MRISTLKHAICLVFVFVPLMASPSPRQLLEKSRELFDAGLYSDALKMLASLDIRLDLDNSEDMKLAFKISAIAYNEQKSEQKARDTIRELLYLDPDYQFNPFDTPQSLIKLANEERALIVKKNELLARANTPPPKPEPPPALDLSPPALEKSIAFGERPQFITTLFPFGINHFYQGSPIKGSIYLGLQALGLLTNVGAFWWKQSYLTKFGSPYLEKTSNRTQFETAQMIQYISLGSVIAIFTASVIDAFITINEGKSEGSFIIATNP